MSLVGYIGAPPTMGSSIFCAETLEVLAKPNTTKARTAKIFFMFVSNLSSVCDWVGARLDIREERGGWMRRVEKNGGAKVWKNVWRAHPIGDFLRNDAIAAVDRVCLTQRTQREARET